MKHDPDWYQNVFEVMNIAELLLVFLLFGFCFAVMIRPYMRKKITVIASGILTAAGGTIIWILSGNGGTFSYSFVVLSAFILMYLMEKEKPLQKIFLCVMFLTLRFICSAVLVEWGLFSIWFDVNVGDISTGMDPDQIVVYYAFSRLISVMARTLLLYLMIRLIQKAYHRNDELSIQELFLLLIPTITPLLEGTVFREYMNIYNQGVGNGYIKENIPPDIMRFLLYLFSYFAVLMVVVLYERVRRQQEENAQMQALEKEIAQIQRSIEQTEILHEQIRTLRHDISNHLMTMERLTETDNNDEARHYLKRLKEEFSASLEGIRCGNPVIDAVLDAKRDMAVKNGIAFQCDFLYPGQPDIDVFDLSVLLNNALDNALRGANGREPWIRINAKGHERFLTILVTNSYTGEKLRLDADGFPVSTKEGEGHGLGLKLIRRISHRYNGETEFIQREGEIELRILLHEKNA